MQINRVETNVMIRAVRELLLCCLPATLLLCDSAENLAADGLLIQVTTPNAPIKDGNRVVGTAPAKSLLWAFGFSEDKKWVSVKVPNSDVMGWMIATDTTNAKLSESKLEEWNSAVNYSGEWNRFMAENDFDRAAEAAESAAKEMQELLTDAFGQIDTNHPAVAIAWNQAGVAMRRARKYERALPYFQRALDLAESALGSRYFTTSVTRANLAEVAFFLGDTETAVREFDVSMPILEVNPSDTVHLEAFFLRHGQALARSHRIFDARSAFEKSLEEAKRRHGERSFDVATVSSSRAMGMESAGYREEAVTHMTSALNLYRELLDPEHPTLVATLNRLGAFNAKLQRFEVSRKYSQEALQIIQDNDGEPASEIPSALNNLGFSLAKLGEFEEAEKTLEESSALMKEVAPDNSMLHSYPLKNQAVLAIERGEFEKAKQLLIRTIELRTAAAGPKHPSIGEAQALLGAVAVAMKDSKLAIDLLTSAVQISEQSRGVDHPDTRELIAELRRLLKEDPAGHEELDLLIAESRSKRRQAVIRESFGATDAEGDGISSLNRFRLSKVLAAAKNVSVETDFFPLEVTVENASVRDRGRVIANLRRGTIVYGLRAESNQGLINVPGQDVTGWISESSVREVTYSASQQNKLQAAGKSLIAAWDLIDAGKSEEGEASIRRVLETLRQEVGDNHPATAITRYSLSSALTDGGDIHASISEGQAAVDTLVYLLGSFHAETAMAKNNLSNAYISAGRPSEAIPFAADAMQVFLSDDSLGSEQALTAGNLGLALGKMSHFEAAREYIEFGLKKSQSKLGSTHQTTARMWGIAGGFHQELQELESCEIAFRNAYEASRKGLGKEHPLTLEAMARYGESLVLNNKIATGRELMEEARAASRKNFGDSNRQTIDADYQYGSLQLLVGQTAEAMETMTSVVDRAKVTLGADHPTTLYYRKTLGEAFYFAEDFNDAMEEFEEALKGYQRTLGSESIDTVAAQNAVGMAAAALGRLDLARSQYESAYRIGRRLLGNDHADVIAYFYNIGETRLMGRDYVSARPILAEAVDYFRKRTEYANATACVAQVTLGILDAAQEDFRSAAGTFDTAARDTFSLLNDVLPSLTEKEQLSFLNQEFRMIRDSLLSLAIKSAGNDAAGNIDVASMSAEWQLNLKSNSHDLLSRQVRALRKVGGQSNDYRRLIQVREQLARKSLQTVPPDVREAHDDAVRKLTDEESRLARTLGASVDALQEKRQWLNVDDVRSSIPKDAVLVTFAKIRHANYRYSSERTRWRSDRYVAWVVPAAGNGRVSSVDLGLAKKLDDAIRGVQAGIHSAESVQAILDDGEVAATDSVQSQLNRLSARLLKPLLEKAGNFEELILSPDGQLWTVPWAAIPTTDGKLLIEQCRIRTLATGRELHPSNGDGAGRSKVVNAPLIIADPDFNGSGTSNSGLVASNVNTRSPRLDVRFSDSFRNTQRLPGTAEEAAAIQAAVEDFSGKKPRVLLRGTATENAVKTARSPQTLVVSTHGFFLNANQAENNSRRGSSRLHQNPLLRCGLLMAGCNNASTLPGTVDDGILTGMEIVNADLRGTELVVLSACETGLGDVRNGEGVAGLRQAFQLAGARSVVASLWQVDDNSTARLMDGFFKNLASGMTKSEALRQAQLTRIKIRRDRNGAAHPFFWAAFAITGSD